MKKSGRFSNQIVFDKKTNNKKKFIAKWAKNCKATGTNLTRWDMRYKGYCPFCQNENETTEHIMLCDNDESIDIWDEAITRLLQKLHKLDTRWYVLVALKTELNGWKRKLPTSSHSYPELICNAIAEQRRIGWRAFLEGLVCIFKKEKKYLKSI